MNNDKPIRLRVDDMGTADDAPELDPIPEGTSGDYAILHRTLPAGQPLKFNDSTVRWDEDRTFTILHHQGNTWMSDTPQETVAMAEAAKHARGDVLVTGLGLGVFQRLAHKAKSITTLELQQEVIDLTWPTVGGHDEVQRVICCDAAEQMEAWCAQDAGPRFDFIYLDTWDRGDYEHLPWINWFVRRAQELLRPKGEIMAWVYERAVRKYAEECYELYTNIVRVDPKVLADQEKRQGMRVGWPMASRFFDAIADEALAGKRHTKRQIEAIATKIARTTVERPRHMEKANDQQMVELEMHRLANMRKGGA